MAWRNGIPDLLQSSLTRAVIFSALTTASGFGSLWLSSHPGTASMGELLMISLAWTLRRRCSSCRRCSGRPNHVSSPAEQRHRRCEGKGTQAERTGTIHPPGPPFPLAPLRGARPGMTVLFFYFISWSDSASIFLISAGAPPLESVAPKSERRVASSLIEPFR